VVDKITFFKKSYIWLCWLPY